MSASDCFCVFPNCNTTEEINLFRFPKKESLRNEWMKICGISHVKAETRVCIKHFRKEDMIGITSTNKIIMKPTAKPIADIKNYKEILEKLDFFKTHVKNVHEGQKSEITKTSPTKVIKSPTPNSKMIIIKPIILNTIEKESEVHNSDFIDKNVPNQIKEVVNENDIPDIHIIENMKTNQNDKKVTINKVTILKGTRTEPSNLSKDDQKPQSSSQNPTVTPYNQPKIRMRKQNLTNVMPDDQTEEVVNENDIPDIDIIDNMKTDQNDKNQTEEVVYINENPDIDIIDNMKTDQNDKNQTEEVVNVNENPDIDIIDNMKTEQNDQNDPLNINNSNNEHKKQAEIPNKKNNCLKCGKTFLSNSALKLHIKTVHEGQKDHNCEICGNDFTQKGHLIQHIKSVHEGVKYDCEICGKTFPRKSGMRRHIQLIHKINLQPPYKCEKCDKVFAQMRNVMRHVRTVHEGIKDYKCEECGEYFGLKQTLQRHIKTEHFKNDDNLGNEIEYEILANEEFTQIVFMNM